MPLPANALLMERQCGGEVCINILLEPQFQIGVRIQNLLLQKLRKKYRLSYSKTFMSLGQSWKYESSLPKFFIFVCIKGQKGSRCRFLFVLFLALLSHTVRDVLSCVLAYIVSGLKQQHCYVTIVYPTHI